MIASRNEIMADPQLSELGRRQKLQPLDQESSQHLAPLEADMEKRLQTLERESKSWADPVRVMLNWEPPSRFEIAVTDSERRERAMIRALESMEYMQRVSLARPEMRQTLLEDAISAGRWDRVGTLLVGGTDPEAGFPGVPSEELGKAFPTWREGYTRIAATMAAVAEIQLRTQEAKGRLTPTRKMALANRIHEFKKAADLNPHPSKDDGSSLRGLIEDQKARNQR